MACRARPGKAANPALLVCGQEFFLLILNEMRNVFLTREDTLLYLIMSEIEAPLLLSKGGLIAARGLISSIPCPTYQGEINA